MVLAILSRGACRLPREGTTVVIANSRRRELSFTLMELMTVVGITGIIIAIAVSGLLWARMSGSEASAIGSPRAISSGLPATLLVSFG